jgi:hypothetical protein
MLSCLQYTFSQSRGKIAFAKFSSHCLFDPFPEIRGNLQVDSNISQNGELVIMHREVKKDSVTEFRPVYVKLLEYVSSPVEDIPFAGILNMYPYLSGGI